MSLPPEHIRIKRRREDEPVETLYIQSKVHLSNRRYTDFFFQRVTRNADGSVVSTTDAGAPSGPSQGKDVKSPRSVSTSGINDGVPLVRPTALGEEFEKKRVVSKKEGPSLGQSPLPTPGSTPSLSRVAGAPVSLARHHRSTSSSVRRSPSSALRRFQIAAPSADPSEKVLHRVSGGVHKNRGDRVMSRAVVIEKRSHQVNDSRASAVLDDLANKIGEVQVDSDVGKTPVEIPGEVARVTAQPVTPRKRHVVNEAEKRWKEESKASRYLDRAQQSRDKELTPKKAQSMADDPGLWDQDSEQLATELEQFAREMTGDAMSSKGSPRAPPVTPPRRPGRFVGISPNKPVLKYPPRLPKVGRDSPGKSGMGYDGATDHARNAIVVDRFAGTISDNRPLQHGEVDMKDAGATGPAKQVATFDTASSDMESEEEKDASYVYDEFIRRPVHDITANPLAAYLKEVIDNPLEVAPRNVGVVEITEEDEQLWEVFAESDDEGKGWDSEDEDSNAEDNPANEYPDEDLEFDDEYDDTNAVYRHYRHNASDDEEFDPDYDNYGYGGGGYNGLDSDEDY
ncbi:hypothetical protein AJ79_02973 [Helicocarpus griseus UAMH5409]|uniref:Transcription factor Iwr1 domain-containing protein n=1 Tax=Helicocarpus griseus UAMH5409 TaxID=1447875 RepID=A0A2B7Y1G0_9EURO|nr:hypothetical protein AJ79_02973 [Helicocarpus griseus UAMH5409]